MLPYMNASVTVDLRDRAERSENFPKEWSKEKLELSIERYKKFLYLASKYPLESIAPTSDIDEIWHLHMLSPVSYYNDCMKLMGKILDHDGGFGAKEEEIPELKATFMKTAKLWEEEFGIPYVDDEQQLDGELKKCWHNCQSRCWNACKS